jgi:hypothetical protein
MNLSSPAVGRRLFAIAAVAGACSWNVGSLQAGLYECRDSSGAPIYTDSPAQLERCQPVAGGTSRLGLVGSPNASASPGAGPLTSSPPPTSEPVSSVAPTNGGLVPSGSSSAVASGSSDTPLCIPGINPLNPFSGPPCPLPAQALPMPSTPPPTGTITSQP